MDSTGSGPGNFAMQLNFADAPALMVPSIASPDWFGGNANVFSTPGVGRTNGTAAANFNSAPGNPRLYETDYNLPIAYQGATLTSITFDWLAGGQINIMGISGDVLTNSNANAVTITADSTIDVTGTATSGLAGATSIGTNTLHVTGDSTGANADYTLSLGTASPSGTPAGGVVLNGNPIFDVHNNTGSGVGHLVLGALNDQGSARTLEFSGAGQTTLGTVATSLVANTIITIDAGATLNSNAAGTASSPGSLGSFAQVSIGAGGLFSAGASQTISSLASASATSKVFIANGTTLGIGNSDNLSTVFAGQITDTDAAHPGSINVGVPGSTGSLTLTNNTVNGNTYHGATTITGGTLILQATANNIAKSSTINVPGGGTLNVTGVTGGFSLASGQTLQGASVLGGGGGGTVNGSVAVGSGATIAGTSTTPGTSLTVNVAGAGPALTLQNASTSSFTIKGSLAGTVPLITTTSGSGQSLNITGANTVTVSSNSILPTEPSTFRLISYTGPALTATGSPGTTLNFTNGGGGSMTLGATPGTFTLSYNYQLSNQTNHIDLTVLPQGLTWAGVDDPAGVASPADATWSNVPANNNWVSPATGNPSASWNSTQAIFSDNYPTTGGQVAVTNSNITVQNNGVQTTGVTFGATSVLYAFTNFGTDTHGIAGTGGLNFVGTAPVTFDSANSFSGPVVISSGQLNLGDGVSTNNDNALGAAAPGTFNGNPVGAGTAVTVGSGATLNLNSVSGFSHTFGNGWNGTAATGSTISLSLAGTGSGNAGILGALNSQSGKNTYAGIIRIAAGGATIASTSTANGDNLLLTGGIDNSSATAAATVTFAGAADSTVSGAIKDAASGANPLSIALAGAGNLTLSGSNTFHGTVTDPGLLILKSTNSLGNSSGVTVTSTGVPATSGGLVLNASGTTGLAATGGAGIPLSLSGVGTNATIPGTTVTSIGALTDVGTSGYGGPINLPNDATIATTAGGDILTLSGLISIGTAGSSRTLTFTGPGSTTESSVGSITDGSLSVLGNIVVQNTLTGTTTFGGSNSYHGTTTVSSGALILTAGNALGNTSSPVTVASGAGLVVSGGTSPLSVGSAANGGAGITLSITGAGVTGNTAATGGTGALTGAGTGVTYSGPITISGGAATIATTGTGATNGSGGTDVLTLSGAINSTSATTTLVGAGTTTATGAVNITSGSLTVPSANGGGTYTFGNQIFDGGTGMTGSVTMSGAGTVNLNSVNTYAGGTLINSTASPTPGKVVTGNTLALGFGDVTLANNGLLRLSTVVSSGFNNGVGWTVNSTGITSNPFPAAQTARLTDGAGNEARSIINNVAQPINNNFTATFTYTPSGGGTRADGATFMLQEVGTGALGGGGGTLGYGGIANPSAAFEINIFNGHTIGTNFVTNGATGTYNATGTVNVNSGDPIKVVLTYNATAGTLAESDTDTTTNANFTHTYNINLANFFGSNSAYIGFTGATGGSASTQQISAFSFVPAVPLPSVYANNVQLTAGATATIDVAATASIPSVTMGNLTSNSGGAAPTLFVTAATAPANQAYGLNLGSVILNNGVTFNVAKNGTGNGTLTLGALNDNATNQTVTINGAGTVLLNTVAAGMQPGSTIAIGGNTVNTGSLVVTSATGSPTGTAAVSVNNGGTLAGTFSTAGTGSIGGNVTVNTGGTIFGNNVNALANNPLTVAGVVTLNGTSGNSISNFTLSTPPNGPPTGPTATKTMIGANGGLVVNGTTNLVTLSGSPPVAFTIGQSYTYDLFSYAGTLTDSDVNNTGTALHFTGGSGGSGGTGTLSLDAVGNLPLNNVYGYTLKNDVANNEIELVVTPQPLTWTGNASSNWNTADLNWSNKPSLPYVAYGTGAAALFADKNPVTNTNVTATTVTITSTGVQNGVVIFQNTGPGNGGVNYTIVNGAGNNTGIGGTAAVTIQGSSGVGGQVTFGNGSPNSGANSFSGALSVGPGQLNLNDVETINGVNYSLGMGNASSSTVVAGGTIALNGATGAARTFGQGYNASSGLAQASLTTPLGLTINGAGVGGNGALISAAGNNTYVGLITVGSGGATISSTGVAASGDLFTIGGGISMPLGGTLTFAGSGNTVVDPLNDGGASNPGFVTMNGTGTLSLVTANNYFGAMTVNSGTLLLSNATALGSSSGVTVASGAALALTGGTSGTPLAFGVRADGSAIPLTISGTGVTNGQFANTGVLANSGVNSYAGPITANASSTIATTTATDSLTLNGTVTLVGGTVGSPNVLTAGGPSGSRTTFNTAINDGAGTGGSGVGKLVISGGNVSLLAGSGLSAVNSNSNLNTYTGGTTINGSGTVVTANSGGFGSGALTLNNNNGVIRVVPTGAGGPSVSTFGGNGTGWTQNGGAFVNGDDAQMTVNPGGATRSLWYNTPVQYQTAGANVGFTAKFTYQFNGGTNPPADGITFTLQNDPAGTAALGGGGGGFGYLGLNNSAAIQLNIYPPANGGQGTAFNTNGGIGNNTAFGAPNTNNYSTSPVTLASATGTPNGNPINVTVFYNPSAQTITESLVDTVTNAKFSTVYTGVNLASILGNNNMALVGFTGATGGSLATQDITNFSFTQGTLPSTYPNTTVTGGISTTIDVAGVFAGDIPAQFGTLTIGSGGATTVNVTDASDAAGAAYGASFGATTLNSNVTFNVANATLGAFGTGTLTLGAVGESGSSRSITKTGAGALTLSGTGTYSGGTSVSNGTLSAAAVNALGTGSLDVSTAGGNVSAANIQANNTITQLTGTVAGGGSATVNVSAGQTLAINQASGTATFAGNVALAAGATAGGGGTLAKSGGGTEVLTGVPALGNNSNLQVSGGSVKFNVAAGTPNVGSGVTATIVGTTGSIELAGAVSVLGVATPAAGRVNISNLSSSATGLLVSSTTGPQIVGGIDGTGTTQVNANARLQANHIVEGALVIGGDATHTSALVTIDASDANGNPLTAGGGGASLTGSLDPSTPFAADAPGSSNSLASDDSSTTGSSASVGAGSSSGGSGSNPAVPEPSTIVMLLIAAAGGLGYGLRRRNRRTR